MSETYKIADKNAFINLSNLEKFENLQKNLEF